MQAGAAQHEYATTLLEKLRGHASVIQRAMGAIDRIICGEALNKAKLPDVLHGIDKLESQHCKHIQFAQQIGIKIVIEVPGKKPSKKGTSKKK